MKARAATELLEVGPVVLIGFVLLAAVAEQRGQGGRGSAVGYDRRGHHGHSEEKLMTRLFVKLYDHHHTLALLLPELGFIQGSRRGGGGAPWESTHFK